jgi:cytochrome P450
MLGMHPHIQDKVVDELKSIFRNENEEPTVEKLKQMKYLELVIKESMRLFPVAPVIGRKISHDLILDGNVCFF